MTVPTIVPSRSATRKNSGFTFSFRAMSLAGSFCGRTKPDSRQRAMTAGSSTGRKERRRTSAMFLPLDCPAHPFGAAAAGVVHVNNSAQNEDGHDQHHHLDERGVLHQ